MIGLNSSSLSVLPDFVNENDSCISPNVSNIFAGRAIPPAPLYTYVHIACFMMYFLLCSVLFSVRIGLSLTKYSKSSLNSDQKYRFL